jgi:myo-inositol 2-dehydrogenase/D-chiro-inositol 1-dehydrogenase
MRESAAGKPNRASAVGSNLPDERRKVFVSCFGQGILGPMRKRQLVIGVIGAGMIGDVHVERIKQDGRGKVAWLAERSPTTLAEKLGRHGIANGTLDYREVLTNPQVEAVIIATPPATHAHIAIEALRAGKHVLLEKPMVHQRSQLRRLLTEVAKHPGQVVLECSCRHSRLQPKFRFVKNIVDSGEIGRVYHIHQQHLSRSTFLDWNPNGVWARSKQQAGGGPLLDWGVYDISFHLGVLGDVPQLTRVHAFTQGGLKVFRDRQLASDVEEHAAALMEFGNGLTYYYERGAGAHLEVANETRICGTRGGLRFAFPSWESAEIELFTVDRRGRETRGTRKVAFDSQQDDNLALIRHFLDCVLKREPALMPVTLAAKHLDILFRIFTAAERLRARSPQI